MKQVFFSVLAGAILTGGAFYFALPKIKQAAYDSGVSEGTKAGTAAGITTGIAQGVAEEKAAVQHKQDSAAAVYKHAMAVKAAAGKRHKKVVKPVQNWHVIDGKISDPIADTPGEEM
jgi:hypothetical protein